MPIKKKIKDKLKIDEIVPKCQYPEYYDWFYAAHGVDVLNYVPFLITRRGKWCWKTDWYERDDMTYDFIMSYVGYSNGRNILEDVVYTYLESEKAYRILLDANRPFMVTVKMSGDITHPIHVQTIGWDHPARAMTYPDVDKSELPHRKMCIVHHLDDYWESNPIWWMDGCPYLRTNDEREKYKPS